ncbi:conserved hypothetical protein [uncultured Desulfatiglans sp.]|nr:conserved hypothetical protein [uncultured Desulfatiglans sp.]
MENGKAVEMVSGAGKPRGEIVLLDNQFPPSLFRHSDLIDGGDRSSVDEKYVINILNYMNFTGNGILLRLQHSRFEESILIRVYPNVCAGEGLSCRWEGEPPAGFLDDAVNGGHLLIDRGASVLVVPISFGMGGGGEPVVRFTEGAYSVARREMRRYVCQKRLNVEVFQSGFLASGSLVDFNARAFKVCVRPLSSGAFQWLNTDEPIGLQIRTDQDVIYSGLCRFVRGQRLPLGATEDRQLVLEPAQKEISRFQRRRIRSPRQRLTPPPTVNFLHPLLDASVTLDVCDLSTSGFSVYEHGDEGLLVQGLIIPELEIEFAGGACAVCSAQVIYRREEIATGSVRCGLAILDMSLRDFNKLANVINKVQDPRAHVSPHINPDALWEFFFETGFIYPGKYALIDAEKSEFKRTIKKLYEECPDIACHFTYQQNSRIFAHVSMVRAYEKAWLIQHHAAKALESKSTGFNVLKQIMYYLYDMCRLPSANMDYLFCYYRPDNKFPDRVFGGFARQLKDNKKCSMDVFAYFTICKRIQRDISLSNFEIKATSKMDLFQLNLFYNHISGGLMLNIYSMLPENMQNNKTIENIYKDINFTRKMRLYSLTYNRKLCAIFILDQSDFGFNFSELINGIKAIILEPKFLPWPVFYEAVNQLAPDYKTDNVPIMIFPGEYVSCANKSPKDLKQYVLWAYDVAIISEFMEFLKKKFRIRYWEEPVREEASPEKAS